MMRNIVVVVGTSRAWRTWSRAYMVVSCEYGKKGEKEDRLSIDSDEYQPDKDDEKRTSEFIEQIQEQQKTMLLPDEKRVWPEPRAPQPHECCGNGCDPCVWTTYMEQYAAWLQHRDKSS